MAAITFMSFYYMACCREEPVLTFESELYFEPLMALSCFTFVNPHNTLSHDSSLGGRRGLLCRCLWWGPVCTVHFFCSVSDFSLTNKFHATEVTPTLEMSSSICSGWSFCIGVMTIAKCHLKQ